MPLFGLPVLWAAVLYAVGALAAIGLVWGMIHGFITWVSEPRVTAARVEMQSKVDEAQLQAREAQRDRDIARGSETVCKGALTVVADARAKADLEAAKNLKGSREVTMAAEKRERAQAPYIAGLQADAAAKNAKALSCDQELKEADAVITEALKRTRGLK